MNGNIQLSHADHKPSDKKYRLSILADSIKSPVNIGSLFRLCDALGIEKLYLCGDSAAPPNTRIKKTSRSTEKYVDYAYHADSIDQLKKLKAEGYLIISLEITNLSTKLGSPEFVSATAGKQPVCLVLGAENTGIDESLLTLSDLTTHIPMHGINSSMNVISAASIACFEIIRNL